MIRFNTYAKVWNEFMNGVLLNEQGFNQPLQNVNFPSQLQTLTFGSCFDRSVLDSPCLQRLGHHFGNEPTKIRYYMIYKNGNFPCFQGVF